MISAVMARGYRLHLTEVDKELFVSDTTSVFWLT